MLLRLLLEFKGMGLMSRRQEQNISHHIIQALVCSLLNFPLHPSLILVMKAIKYSSDKHRETYGHLTHCV